MVRFYRVRVRVRARVTDVRGLGGLDANGGESRESRTLGIAHTNREKQERPAVADKPARRLRKVCTVYVRAVGL